MAFHTRTQSKDITSNAAHATPLPTYYSQQLPRWTSKSAFEDQKAFEVKTEPFVPIYPQFPAPMPRFDDIPLPPRPERQRLPRKAILIPWILAVVFLFMTLWFASIALGVRLFMVLQPGPTNPPVQEIRIVINEDMLRGSAAAYTTFVTLTSSTTPSTAVASASTLPRDESAVPTTTGHLDTAATSTDRLEVFTTEAPVPRDIKMRPTGFITVARMM